MNKNKIIIISSVSVLVIVAIIIAVMIFKTDEKPFYNIPEGSILVEEKNVLKDQKVGDLTVTNVLLYKDNNKSKYSATITNKSSKEQTVKLAIIFHEGNIKNEIIALNDKIIKAKDKTNIEITFDIDLTKITKIEYVLK